MNTNEMVSKIILRYACFVNGPKAVLQFKSPTIRIGSGTESFRSRAAQSDGDLAGTKETGNWNMVAELTGF